ncbi:MAG: hypothetical protein H0T73_03850 [Ardenticatenales bacterium]|nr:hypothetical protein [Ardenticatenales bacterium]
MNQRAREWGGILLLALAMALIPAKAPDVPQFYDAARAWPEPYSIPLERMGDGWYRIFTPWAVVLFLPLALGPQLLAAALVRALTIIAFYLLTGRSLWKTIVLIFSPPALILLMNGNLDAISGLGALLPGSGALLLLMVKPQAAALSALPILRRDGWWHALLPLVLVVLSTLLWPEWLERAAAARGGGWNVGALLFPYSIPVGLLLLLYGWRERDPIPAAIATPLLSLYVSLPTLAVTGALLLRRWPRLGVLICMLPWLWVIISW